MKLLLGENYILCRLNVQDKSESIDIKTLHQCIIKSTPYEDSHFSILQNSWMYNSIQILNILRTKHNLLTSVNVC